MPGSVEKSRNSIPLSRDIWPLASFSNLISLAKVSASVWRPQRWGVGQLDFLSLGKWRVFILFLIKTGTFCCDGVIFIFLGVYGKQFKRSPDWRGWISVRLHPKSMIHSLFRSLQTLTLKQMVLLQQPEVHKWLWNQVTKIGRNKMWSLKLLRWQCHLEMFEWWMPLDTSIFMLHWQNPTGLI